ncbi:MAG: DUF935 family protein [Patescibacteria group bacterium]|nr:DUF935 family protein [Patescibacteria group bacterium]
MKALKILGLKVAEFGDVTAPVRRGTPVAGGSLAPAATEPVPQSQLKYLNPRYEPGNITSNATVVQVQDAIRQAENGSTMDLFRFYRDILMSDDHIQSCINTRKLAVLAQPLSILPKDKNSADDVALAAAMMQAREDCENWNAGMIALMDSNCLYPASAAERLFKPADKNSKIKLQFTLRRFVPVNPQLLCYQWAYLTGGVGLGQASAIQLANITADDAHSGTALSPYQVDLERWEPWIKLWPIDPQGRIIYDVSRAEYLDEKRHIVHRGHMLNARDNWGGPGRAILMWWLLRNLGREWFARGMERYANPFPVGYTDVTDPQAVALLRQAFDLMATIGGLVVDENSRIELKEAMVQGMAQGYETFHRLCNEAISFHITGLKESQKPAGLNAGQSNFSGTVREDVRMFDQMTLAETCERQIARPFAEVNGLAGAVKFVWGGLSDADAKTFADFLNTMKQAGFTPADGSLATINERTGLTWEKAEPPAMGIPPSGGAQTNNDPRKKPDGVESLSANLTWLSAGNPSPGTPVDDVVAAHQDALARAFRGALAPVRQVILSSTSPRDAEHKLKLLFADWPTERIAGIVAQAMQVCAAKGAASHKT